jgi:hypothetical protein
MKAIEKANATGRSSGTYTGRLGASLKPPKGEPWVWLTRELIASAAWRLRSVNCIRFIDFLLVEQLNHAATENGNLMATYDQLVVFGLTRSEIHPAIEEAVFLGLAEVVFEGGRWADTNQPSRYRLTFYVDKEWNPATDEWKGKTEEAIKAWKKNRAKKKQARKEHKKNLDHGATSQTTVVLLSELSTQKQAGGKR